ncbi:hypothetical protein Tco_1391149 [Tanacetum coccineum]
MVQFSTTIRLAMTVQLATYGPVGRDGQLYVFVVVVGVIRWRCLSYVGADQFRIRLENNTQQSLKFIFVAMEAGASSSNLRIMNQEFVKLDKFDGVTTPDGLTR